MPLFDVRSQDQAVRVLQRAWAIKKLHHGWLLSGPSGVGKTLLAREMGRLLICESPTADHDACGRCRPCRSLDSSGHPDVITVGVDEGKKKISVETIRRTRALLNYPPHGHRDRAVLFEKADLMSEEAQNALLKTLEEPSTKTYLFLTTASPSSLLPTILSRCSRLELSPLPRQTLEELIQRERPDLAQMDITLASNLSGGSVTTALDLADSGLTELTAQVDAVDDALGARKVPSLLELAEEMAKDRPRMLITLDLLALWYRDVMLIATSASDQSLAFTHRTEVLADRAQHLGVCGASDRIAAALEASRALTRRNANARITAESMLLRMLT